MPPQSLRENQVLMTFCIRPLFVPEMVGILLRWRNSKIVMMVDIENAYLQVGLDEPDRKVTRFLWVRDISRPPEGENLLVYRYGRVLLALYAAHSSLPLFLGII